MSDTRYRLAGCLHRRHRRRQSSRQKSRPNLTNSQGCPHSRRPPPHPATDMILEIYFVATTAHVTVSYICACRRCRPPSPPLVRPPDLPPQRPNHLPVHRVELEHRVGLPLARAVTGVLHHSLEIDVQSD